MDSQHSIVTHISSLEVHDQTDDMRTLWPFLYQMLWHKYDINLLSLYFDMFCILNLIFHQTFCF